MFLDFKSTEEGVIIVVEEGPVRSIIDKVRALLVLASKWCHDYLFLDVMRRLVVFRRSLCKPA